MRWVRTLWEGWKIIARKIAVFQTRLLLSLIYFLVVTPFAMFVRCSRDPLRLGKGHDSNWIARYDRPYTLDGARNQY